MMKLTEGDCYDHCLNFAKHRRDSQGYTPQILVCVGFAQFKSHFLGIYMHLSWLADVLTCLLWHSCVLLLQMLITQLVHRTILLSRSSRPENESITSGKREDAHHPSRVASSKKSFFWDFQDFTHSFWALASKQQAFLVVSTCSNPSQDIVNRDHPKNRIEKYIIL